MSLLRLISLKPMKKLPKPKLLMRQQKINLRRLKVISSRMSRRLRLVKQGFMLLVNLSRRYNEAVDYLCFLSINFFEFDSSWYANLNICNQDLTLNQWIASCLIEFLTCWLTTMCCHEYTWLGNSSTHLPLCLSTL